MMLFSLNPGDSLFVYTDGIPEATNSADEQYEESRMLNALNENPDACPREILEAFHRSVKAFAGDAPQFDDMTMLCIKLKEC
ncbi:MAG: SpoIIE family protein phosphatase [Lachnospiraceae bacterium]|nr:SpoIIE family protein phosphatase [Lachnospiraceae bacterium]